MWQFAAEEGGLVPNPPTGGLIQSQYLNKTEEEHLKNLKQLQLLLCNAHSSLNTNGNMNCVQ